MMSRDDETKALKVLAEKVWPGVTLEIAVWGGLRQPAEVIEIEKVTMCGRDRLFVLRHADAISVAERMLRALLDKEVPCLPPPPSSCSKT